MREKERGVRVEEEQEGENKKGRRTRIKFGSGDDDGLKEGRKVIDDKNMKDGRCLTSQTL